ncbi:Aste57867_15881 [Aphanomyces stellatus]|uniref:Aste57867_15881 protein n=1 Tax=Aphanomyces stellatus TaxID=120398 RepID=A0A485L466_9STRA|nr:hypothetical protein As57867_015825 [Aphanomyces stellatus]VFT92668.1 Aste57867_15881 [Aphanomyces stellatus]
MEDADAGNTTQNIRAAAIKRHHGGGFLHADPPPKAVRLSPTSGVGFNTNLRDMLLYINKNEVIYAIGKYAALQNIHSQKMAFFEPPSVHPGKAGSTNAAASSTDAAPHDETSSTTPRMGDICAMAVTVKRNYLAIARSTHSSTLRTEATISIYSLKAKGGPATAAATIHNEENQLASSALNMAPIRTLAFEAHGFSSLAFSHDGKFIVGQATTADWTFVLWDWTRARRIATADAHTKVTRICFNPIDVAQLSTSGGVHLRLWRLSEPTCRPFATFNSANSAVRYVDHTWVGKSDGMVAILDNGDVQYFSNGELVRTIPSLHHGHMLQCVVAFKTSVVVGGDRGYISVLEIDTFNGADIHTTKRMRLDTKESVVAISMDVAGAGFMCATPSLYGAYDLSNLCLLREDDEVGLLSSESESESDQFVSLITFTPLPRLSALTSLALSSRRHVFAVTGKRSNGANVVCFYSQNGTSGVLHHSFVHLVPSCLDVHPSGFEVILSFSGQVHIYHVLYDSLKLAFEVDIKHATTVAYSPGGNYFVCVVDDKTIFVYRNFGAMDPVLVSVCPVREANVTCLAWGVDDVRFYTADDGGSLIEWGMGSDGLFKATQETTTQTLGMLDRPLAYSSLAVARHVATGKPIVAACCDTSVLHIWATGQIGTAPSWTSPNLEMQITALEFGPSSVLCVGTSSGTIWVYTDASGGLCPDPTPYDLSMSAVFSLRCCLNDRVLLAASVDGTVLASSLDVHAPPPIFAGVDVINASLSVLQATPENQFTAALLTDELCLVDRVSVAEKMLRITDLETEKEQIKTEKEILTKLNAEQLSLVDRERQNELRAVKAALEAKIRAAEDEMHAKVADAQASVVAMKKDNEKSLQTMQSIFSTKLSSMNDVCRQLERQVMAERHRVDDAIFGGEEQRGVLREEMEAAQAKAVAEADARARHLATQLAFKEKQYDELLSQQNDDHLIHVGAMQASIDRDKADVAAAADAAKTTISSLQQQLRMMLNALATKDERIGQVEKDVARLTSTVETLQSELSVEKKRAAKAVSDCAALDAHVVDQTRKIEGLEELNNVRLCKLKTMKQTIAAKEEEAHEMRAFVEELHAENSAVVEDANAMDDAHGQMKGKIAFFERSMAEQKTQLMEAKAIVAAFRRDLGILIDNEQQGNRLKIDAIVKLYHKYDLRNSKGRTVQREMASDEAIIQELSRQNKCVEDHRRKLRSRLEAMGQERQKLVSVFSTDNTKMLEQMNGMKRENQHLHQRISLLELQAKHTELTKSTSTPLLSRRDDDNQATDDIADRASIVTDVANDQPRIYIPCGVHVKEPNRASPVTTLRPISRSRPRSGHATAGGAAKAKPRPKSAHPTQLTNK